MNLTKKTFNYPAVSSLSSLKIENFYFCFFNMSKQIIVVKKYKSIVAISILPNLFWKLPLIQKWLSYLKNSLQLLQNWNYLN